MFNDLSKNKFNQPSISIILGAVCILSLFIIFYFNKRVLLFFEYTPVIFFAPLIIATIYFYIFELIFSSFNTSKRILLPNTFALCKISIILSLMDIWLSLAKTRFILSYFTSTLSYELSYVFCFFFSIILFFSFKSKNKIFASAFFSILIYYFICFFLLIYFRLNNYIIERNSDFRNKKTLWHTPLTGFQLKTKDTVRIGYGFNC